MGKAKAVSASAKRPAFRYDGTEELPVSCLPYLGDFVVLSLDPQRSVAHLDSRARQLAAQIKPKQYIAMASTNGSGLPSKFKPTNEFFFSLVRQRTDDRAEASSLPLNFNSVSPPATLIPIASCTIPATGNPAPLKAVADFPFSGCSIDLAAGSLYVRVTNARRDRTPVLPLPFKEVLRLKRIRREYTRRIAASSAAQHAEGDSPSLERATSPTRSPRHAPPTSDTEPTNDLKDMATIMSALIDYTGDPEIPVVNVHYDLGVLDTVEDPLDLRREEQEILKIMRDAKERMTQAGIQPRFPKSSLPWDDGILDDIERVAQDSLMAVRKMSSSIWSPVRTVQRSLRGWRPLKRFGAQEDSRASRTSLPPEFDMPQSRPSSPPMPMPILVQPQRAASPAPTLVLSYDEVSSLSAPASSALAPTRIELASDSLPPAPAPVHAELPPSPTATEELVTEDSLSFTPNAPHADVYPSPSVSPVPPGGHLPSRKVGRTGTDASEEFAYRK